MRIASASVPGSPARANEDWVSATSRVIVVLDGATARTETGCTHGVAWYAASLGAAVVGRSGDHQVPLRATLAGAIRDVAALHPECDLSHPGTPSAAAAVVRFAEDQVEYLVLGDVCVILDLGDEVRAITDDRVSRTARRERAEADRHPIGSPQKQQALIRMKRVELALRNRPDGYWVAETKPEAADHALTGTFPLTSLRRLAVVTDGAARAVSFGLMDFAGLLDTLDSFGPAALIDRVRAAERSDPLGVRWPRNKRSDDASVVHVRL